MRWGIRLQKPEPLHRPVRWVGFCGGCSGRIGSIPSGRSVDHKKGQLSQLSRGGETDNSSAPIRSLADPSLASGLPRATSCCQFGFYPPAQVKVCLPVGNVGRAERKRQAIICPNPLFNKAVASPRGPLTTTTHPELPKIISCKPIVAEH